VLTVERLDADAAAAAVPELAEVLAECVEAGASVSFMAPFDRALGVEHFETAAREVAAGRRIVLAARDGGGRLVGTVQVLLAMPPNQPHRGEIAKLLVRPSARRQGIAQALMERAEAEAAAAGKTLLLLDTASDVAERLYARLGWTRLGVVPDFALLPDGAPCDTTFFWKRIGA
jgi:GNAT superfamily N-acetyltransferase